MVINLTVIETKVYTATLTAPPDGHNHPFRTVKDEDVIVKFTTLPSQFISELIPRTPGTHCSVKAVYPTEKELPLKRLKNAYRCSLQIYTMKAFAQFNFTTVHGALSSMFFKRFNDSRRSST